MAHKQCVKSGLAVPLVQCGIEFQIRIDDAISPQIQQGFEKPAAFREI